jgi:hypothetical protein
MSRVAFLLAAASLAAMIVPASAGEPALTSSGLPIAPNGGKASLHQWGALDDAFAVNPDGDVAPAKPTQHFAPMAQDQGDHAGDDDAGDPGVDFDNEILAI